MNAESQIEFHSGLDTIGGNIVSIQKGKYRIIMDFGALAGVDHTKLGREQQLAALYQSQQLPQIKGIYRADQLEEAGQLAELTYEASDIETIVLLSHLHLDHVGSLSQLHPEIPVYVLAEALPFYHELSREAFLPVYPVNWQGVEVGETLTFGPFKINFHASDHDTLGIAAIFIETDDLRLIYSGDIRLTGSHPERVLEWLLEARAFQPDVLLLEGTTYSFSNEVLSPLDEALAPIIEDVNLVSEKAFDAYLKQLLVDYPQELIAFNGYVQNMDRFRQIAEILAPVNRILVLQENYYRYLKPYLSDFRNVAPLNLAESLAIGVNPEMIQANPAQYLLQIDEHTYQQLATYPAGILLHSNGVPLGSFMQGYEEYVREITSNGWRYLRSGVSGHATKEDLLTIAYLVDAQVTIPWHTRERQAYLAALAERGIVGKIVEADHRYSVAELKG